MRGAGQASGCECEEKGVHSSAVSEGWHTRPKALVQSVSCGSPEAPRKKHKDSVANEGPGVAERTAPHKTLQTTPETFTRTYQTLRTSFYVEK